MPSDVIGPDDPETEGLSGDALILVEAKSRFKRCAEWEADFRRLALEDLKFSLGDSDNGWQWDEDIMSSRQLEEKVTLTLNKVRVHCLQIENETRKNKPSINIRPTGNGATFEAAQVYEGIARHIQYVSRASEAYLTANFYQVRCGIGYVRLVTDYLGPKTFDQEIYIRRIKDQSTVYLDPDINEVDGLDARFGFVFDDMPKDEYRVKYPEHLDVAASGALGDGMDIGYIGENHVRVCEYFRKTETRDVLIRAVDPADGSIMLALKSDLPPEVWERLDATLDKKTREVSKPKVEHFTFAGDTVIDRKDWAGIYVPIFRAVGEEAIVEKRLERKGHVRSMKDPQREYNYWASATTESIAMQPIQPWILDPLSIEGNEDIWKTANRKKHAYLPVKTKSDDGFKEFMKPERVAPPTVPQALIEGMRMAQEEMMMVTGQYQAQLGENENAKSGKAIAERQAQGDNATYHFNEGMATMIRAVGKALIDLIPKIYDTPGRIVTILAEDESEDHVEIDPQQKQALGVRQQQSAAAAARIFNPTVGTYDVEADIGPDYATKRQEAFNALTQLMSANKELVLVAGDLLMKAADFPMADELAQRLRRMVPPQALGEAPPPQLSAQIAELTKQNAGLSNIVAELTKKIAEDAIKLRGKDELRDIEAYRAKTERMIGAAKAEKDATDSRHALAALLQRTIHDSRSLDLQADAQASEADLAAQEPAEAA